MSCGVLGVRPRRVPLEIALRFQAAPEGVRAGAMGLLRGLLRFGETDVRLLLVLIFPLVLYLA